MASSPLPPPLEVPGISPASQDPYNLASAFSGADGAALSPTSSTSEPKPGEPLSAEAEELLSGIGGDVEPDDEGGPAELPAETGADLLPPILFSTEKTEAVLIEIFDWAAERFDSDHWKLTGNQVRMLGEPTAQLLGGVWTRLAEKLPDILISTPGAAAFLLACTIVIVPKAAQQVAISRARRQGKAPVPPRRAASGPVPMPPSRRPIGGNGAREATFNPLDAPIAESTGGNDFQVTGE